MEINKIVKDGCCKMELSGRLDTITSPQLEEELKSLPENLNELILDLQELEYVSSAGLRVFLNAQKQMSEQGKMTLRNVNDEIMEVLEMTGFTSILTIE